LIWVKLASASGQVLIFTPGCGNLETELKLETQMTALAALAVTAQPQITAQD
jgi:hypothetical protein